MTGILHAGKHAVADYDLGEQLPPHLSPRPHLHPVRTLGGTVVTDARPEDHPWHLGVSLAVPQVSGTNLWGGPTYVRDAGYRDLGDHGRQRHERWLGESAGEIGQELSWLSRSGAVLAEEQRTLIARLVPGGEAWVLTWTSTIRAQGDPLRLGNPETNGRSGAAYGGIFWRGPRSGSAAVLAADTGPAAEDAVNGRPAPWVAVCGGSQDAGFTCVFRTRGPQRPWFVRVDEYPGVCPAIAQSEPLTLASRAACTLSLEMIVADGRMSFDAVRAMLAGLPRYD